VNALQVAAVSGHQKLSEQGCMRRCTAG
jgi:hypothetical protein